MYEVVQRLRGISCILSLFSFQADTTIYEHQTEAMQLLKDGIDSCIKELENMNKE